MESKEKGDLAAAEAEQELSHGLTDDHSGDTFDDGVRFVAAWWAKWKPEAGHKRLGRVLVELAGEEVES